jgi:hypothetical protein
MVKCPVCHFSNEDGALFCEQCKSDLASVPVAAPAEAIPMAAVAVDEPIADVILSPMPIEAIPLEPVPEAKPLEPIPILEALPVEATPAHPSDVAATHAAPAGHAVPPALAALEPEATMPAPPKAEAAPAPAAPVATPSLAGAQPKLKVIRGLKIGVEFPIYPEYNYIGRADEKPVDIDLEDQEPPDRVWCSRQHSVIHFDEAGGVLTIEDLNSSNGTYVNRNKVYPGQKKQLAPNDVVQIGTVHLKVMV